MAGISTEKQVELADRRNKVMARFNALSREKGNCQACITRVPECRQPHAFPVKTVALELGLRRSTVSKDIESCRGHWIKWHLDPAIVARETEITHERLELVHREALAEWQRSKEPYTETHSEASSKSVESGAMGATSNRAKKIVKEQTGGSEYLRVLVEVEAQRMKLYGMAAPARVAVTDTHGEDLFGWMAAFAKHALRNVIDITPESLPALPPPVEDGDVAELVESLMREENA